MVRFPCPCCGFRTLTARSAYDLCPVCYWEDDGFHGDDVASLSGPNGMTLAEGQRLFEMYGTSALHCLPHVRAPEPEETRDPTWRSLPLDESNEARRTYFLSDLGQLLQLLTEDSRREARESRVDADISYFEGVRAALGLLIDQARRFGLPLDEVGIEASLDLSRDMLLDPPTGRFAG